MKKCFKLSVLLISLLTICIFASCGKDNEELILGKWTVDKAMAIESQSNSDYVDTDMVNYFVSMEFLEGGKGAMVMDEDLDYDDDDDDDSDVKSVRKVPESMSFTWTLTNNDERLIIYIEEENEAAEFVVKELKKNKMILYMSYTDEGEEDGVRVVYTEEFYMYLSK